MTPLTEESIKKYLDKEIKVVFDFEKREIMILDEIPVIFKYTTIEVRPTIVYTPLRETVASYSATVIFQWEGSKIAQTKHLVVYPV